MNVRALLLVSSVLVGCHRETSSTTTTEAASAAAASPAASGGTKLETVAAKCLSTGTRGNGEITRTTRDAKGFTDVSVSIVGDVEVKEGAAFEVQIETDANVQDMIKAETNGTKLDLGGSGSYCTNKLHIVVTMPLFHGASLQGSGKLDVTKTTAASDVALTGNGSGAIAFRGAASALAITLNGSGSVLLDTGSASATSVHLNGSGSIRKNTFNAAAVTQQKNGSGSIAL